MALLLRRLIFGIIGRYAWRYWQERRASGRPPYEGRGGRRYH